MEFLRTVGVATLELLIVIYVKIYTGPRESHANQYGFVHLHCCIYHIRSYRFKTVRDSKNTTVYL